MATTYSWSGTNTTASSVTHAPIKLGLKSNYGEVRPKKVVEGASWLKNGTGDGREYISLIGRIQRGLSGWLLPILNPNPIKDFYNFGVETQTILKRTADDGTVVDLPILIKSTIVCPITDDLTIQPANGHSYVDQALMRHLGALYHDDGSERFSEIAKGLIIPSAD